MDEKSVTSELSNSEVRAGFMEIQRQIVNWLFATASGGVAGSLAAVNSSATIWFKISALAFVFALLAMLVYGLLM